MELFSVWTTVVDIRTYKVIKLHRREDTHTDMSTSKTEHLNKITRLYQCQDPGCDTVL